MAIERFSFHDKGTGWRLEPVHLGSFNLLVGLSGVGKTRTLQALSAVTQLAQGRALEHEASAWEITFSLDGQRWTWRAEVAATTTRPRDGADDGRGREALGAYPSGHAEGGRFLSETLEDADGAVLVRRDGGRIWLGSDLVPRLKADESAISLLRGEATIAPALAALAGVRPSKAGLRPSSVVFPAAWLNALVADCGTLDQLKRHPESELLPRAYVLQTRFPETFAEVVEQYRDIFPTVEEVAIGPLSRFRPNVPPEAAPLVVALREAGVAGWIPSREISSGMLRTLLHLLEVSLAPPGTVFLVDEYENSLGVNCLPQVTSLLHERSAEVQFIFTSHHPYVINNVDLADWRILRRNGSVVRACSAAEIPRLTGLSRQAAFVKLINAPEYLDGITG